MAQGCTPLICHPGGYLAEFGECADDMISAAFHTCTHARMHVVKVHKDTCINEVSEILIAKDEYKLYNYLFHHCMPYSGIFWWVQIFVYNYS